MLQAGAQPSKGNKRDSTPLHVASHHDVVDVIETLLASGAAVHALDVVGFTPLQRACHCGHLRAAKLLLDAGGRPDSSGHSIINALFAANEVSIVKLLLERGASTGMNPLHNAAMFGRSAGIMCALYKGGCDPTELDWDGATPADLARSEGHEDAAVLLDMLADKHRAMNASSTA